MVSSITPEFRKKLKQYLKEHPIDPAYDEECELFDGDVPAEQLIAVLPVHLHQKVHILHHRQDQ